MEPIIESAKKPTAAHWRNFFDTIAPTFFKVFCKGDVGFPQNFCNYNAECRLVPAHLVGCVAVDQLELILEAKDESFSYFGKLIYFCNDDKAFGSGTCWADFNDELPQPRLHPISWKEMYSQIVTEVHKIQPVTPLFLEDTLSSDIPTTFLDILALFLKPR